MVVEEMAAGLGEEDVNRRSSRGHREDLHASGGTLEGG
jgi:hypothetical protein